MDLASAEPSTLPPPFSRLFLRFLVLGLTAFGGPAMVTYIQKLAVNQEHWLDQPTFHKGVALCQTVPGATAMQTAAYVGLKARGIAGALVTFVAFGLPAVLLMLILSILYTGIVHTSSVTVFFTGLQAIVVAIVAAGTFTFGKQLITRYRHVIPVGIAAILFLVGIHPILIILLSGVIGVLSLRATTISNNENPIGTIRVPTSVVIGLGLIAIAGMGLIALFFINPILFSLAFTMARIDLFAFGGGQAALPLMLQDVVVVHGWMNSSTFLDGVALGQITPGPIVVTATFVGYLINGWTGALCATVGMFTPSFLIIVLTEPYYEQLLRSPWFSSAFQGIILSFVGLLLSTTVKFTLAIPWTWFLTLLTIGVLAGLLKGFRITWIVAIGLVLSVLYGIAFV